LRIGFIVWEYPPKLVGGLGTYAEYITREFVELGHDVTVFTLNPGNLKTREIMKGVEIHRPLIADASNIFPMFVTDNLKKWGANIRLFNDIFIYNILSATKLINDLIRKKGYKFDLVAVHDWLGSIAGIIIKNETKIPVVFHVHSTEYGRTGGKGSEVVSHFESATAKASDRIITVSHTMREDLIKHGWPAEKIGVVWNGIDPARYDPSKYGSELRKNIRNKYGINDDENLLFFVGRLNWVKGVVNLIQAMPMILKKYSNTKLLILGEGEDENEIKETISRLGMREKVICHFDYISEDQRILHYAASDVCVFPSVYEPFGIVCLEAMAMEKPVVVGARGVVGFREQVLSQGENQNGIHINGDSVTDIAWGIKEVLKDLNRAEKWGKNGRDRVLEYFTWEKVAEQTIEIYESTQ
jgi:glycogen(starch) synthase